MAKCNRTQRTINVPSTDPPLRSQDESLVLAALDEFTSLIRESSNQSKNSKKLYRKAQTPEEKCKYLQSTMDNEDQHLDIIIQYCALKRRLQQYELSNLRSSVKTQ